MPNRRTFLKRASGLVAAVAAPLFIPSERLDFGVPRQRIVVPEPTEWLKIIGGDTDPEFDRRLVTAFLHSPPVHEPMPLRMRMQDSADGQTWRDVQSAMPVRRFLRTVYDVAGAERVDVSLRVTVV